MCHGDSPTTPESVHSPSFLPLSSVIPYLSPVVSSTPASHRAYQSRKLEVRFVSGLLGFLTLLSIVLTGMSGTITAAWAAAIPNPYGVLLAVIGSISVIVFIIRFPFVVYSGIVLEREFGLLRQSLVSWLGDLGKGLLVGTVLGAGVVASLYWCVTAFGALWWLPLGSILFILQMMMAVVGPKVLLPFFYKLTPLEDEKLRDRIEQVCKRADVRADGIFVIGFGEKTKKANAALTGLGPSKRIVLSDTLIENLRDEEVEAVFAHEVGHLKLRHIWFGIAAGLVTSFVSLYLVSVAYAAIIDDLGTYQSNIAMLPLLGALLTLTSVLFGPLSLWLSRWQEFAADRYAVGLGGDPEPLANALRKLGRINLADPDPHPFLERLTYSHPSLTRRLAALRAIGR